MRYIIAYDIENDRTRNKIAKILEGYGIRVQKSVFECKLTKRELSTLEKKFNELINTKTDSVLIQFLCEKCYAKRHFIGTRYDEKIINSLFV